jgi:hypothetical protein
MRVLVFVLVGWLRCLTCRCLVCCCSNMCSIPYKTDNAEIWADARMPHNRWAQAGDYQVATSILSTVAAPSSVLACMLLQNNLMQMVTKATTFSNATMAAAQLHKRHACQEVWKLAQQLLEHPGEALWC